MADGMIERTNEARERAFSMPLDEIDVSAPELFRDNTLFPYFERLRRDDPVHYCADSAHGPYWAVTRFQDIVQVDSHHEIFSSEGGITITPPEDWTLPMFIAMDPPKHDQQRKVVMPALTSANVARLGGLIRQRAGALLDALPIGETFDWVDRVSIELTTQMLATLFDFPWEDRRLLSRWSDVSTAVIGEDGPVKTHQERRLEMRACGQYFAKLWHERAAAPPADDLISLMAHADATRKMAALEFLGNLILLIVGGNDTTRNSITGGLLALNQNPDQYQKLRDNPGLIESMVPEIIRWQTPLAHMRRTALVDTELGGKRIKKGDKVVMWYISGNRDETAIAQPDAFIIDREHPRHHLSFGFGIHRCVGSRLAELQLRIVWEEILKRWDRIEVVDEPRRVFSCFVRGYESMPVRIHP